MDGTLFESVTARFFLNLAATSVVIGILATIVRMTLRRALLPLKHGVLCLALSLILISPLTVSIASRFGFGWIKIPLDRGVLIEGDIFPYSSAALHDDFSNVNAGMAGVHDTFHSTSDIEDLPAAMENNVSNDRLIPLPAKRQVSWMPHGGIDAIQSIPELLAVAFLVIWGIGSVYLCCRLMRHAVKVIRLKRSLPASTNPRLDDLSKRVSNLVGLKSPVTIVESSLIAVPVTLGWASPVIGLPPELAQVLDDEQLTSVLLHEAAHVARHDQLVGLFQHVSAALYWWNPLLHSMNAAICRTREQLCDDITSIKQGSGIPLAQSIVRVAEWAASTKPGPSISVALLEDYRALEDRITRLTAIQRVIQTQLTTKSSAMLGVLAAGLFCVSVVPLLNAYEYPDRQVTHISTRILDVEQDSHAPSVREEGDDEDLSQ